MKNIYIQITRRDDGTYIVLRKGKKRHTLFVAPFEIPLEAFTAILNEMANDFLKK